MDDEQQARPNGNGCSIVRHFIADAARFIRVERFLVEWPFKI